MKLTLSSAPNGFGGSAFESDFFELPDNVMAPKRKSDLDRQAFAREIVDDVHSANVSAGRKMVVHKVDRPTFVRPENGRHRIPVNIPNSALLARANLQA